MDQFDYNYCTIYQDNYCDVYQDSYDSDGNILITDDMKKYFDDLKKKEKKGRVCFCTIL